MNETVKIAIPVAPETARALSDSGRMQAVGRLVDRMVRPTEADDPLAAVLDATRQAARAAGLTDADVDRELDEFRARRR